jgi:DNA processing protein
VVIVEAAARSGTLMTANKALDENREILVVPGPPLVESYTGSLELICQGAGLARDAKDIIFNIERRNVLKLKEETPTLWE